MAGTNNARPTAMPGRNFSAGVRRDAVTPAQGGLASLSLEAVERMLREEVGVSAAPAAPRTATAAPRPTDIPPPLFGDGPARPSEAVPPTSAPVPSPTPAGSRLADLVRADGSVDIEAVYRLGRVPKVALSAELLLKALSALPKDVPPQARRAAVRVTVTTLGQAVSGGADSQVAVAQDALLRRKRLEQFLDGLEAEVGRVTAPLRDEIRRLEEQLAAKWAEFAAHEATLEGARRSCGERIAALDEIVTLLHQSDSSPPAPVAEEDDEELPPFMREDSVRRLIGLSGDAA